MPQAVSSRYARALADAVLHPKSGLDIDHAKTELRRFSALVQASSELKNIFLSPAVTPVRKRAVVARFAATLGVSRLIRNFLYVLIDKRRIGLLHDICEAFEAEIDLRTGVVKAEVTSAAPLGDGERAEVQSVLARLTGKQVRAEFSTDADLIGGATARVGSTIYDGSIRGQLKELRARLISQ